MVEKNAPSMKY